MDESLPIWLSGAPGAWRIRIAAQPGAARAEIVGEHDGCLKVRVAAPPVDGRANEAIAQFLAERLGVPKRSVRLVAGPAGRRKLFEVSAALDRAALLALLYQGARP
ncbi:MAG: DUF167 domain-containing protein [Burkholderiaceae bacterium]|nr:DUF167 domain-containing protein [Burkholderiaceae bacterium]